MEKIFDQFEYDPQSVIGVGGMGTVFQGTDTTTGEAVAVKYLKPEIVQASPEMVSRFRREGEALRELNHPNIVKMLEAGMCDNDHYLVMEYVPGGTLRDLLDEEPQLSLQQVLYVALDLADALTRAHRLKILHRDIKPGNVLLAEDGTPRLTDFGVARTRASEMTADGQIVGTLAYISPEALTGGTLDERHDIWAFGVLLFEMLAGHRPFQAEAIGALIQQITMQPVPDLEKLRPDIPVALVDLVYRMMDRNLATRVRSVRQVGAALETIIYSDGTDTPVGLIPSQVAGRFRTTTAARVVDTSTPSSETVSTPSTGTNPRLVNLPVQATPFVGRTREVAELTGLLKQPDVRLVTMVGPGGTGKTRVAVAAAKSLLGTFPDGVYFVPLASIEQADMVSMKVAEVLGFQFSGGNDPVEEMMAFMRDKRALLVLDNLEHLMDGIDLLSSKMEMAPHIKLLATSRERLRLRGEHVYELDSMIVPPEDVTDPDALGSFPSVQLFMSSAARVAPSFVLDAQTAPLVSRVINLVAGMPLGIELAAGWLEMLRVDEIASEIEQSMDFLESNLRDVPERHRSIHAVFDYSWDLMTDDERDTFMKLSVFRGGFERAAAQKITGASLRVLTGLVNKSLLNRRPDGRYVLAKLSRQYGEAQAEVDPDTMDPVYETYVENYTTFIEQLVRDFGSARDIQALKTAEVEIENLRHAMKIAIERLMVNHIQRLALPLNLYYFARSLLLESVTVFESARAALEGAGLQNTQAYAECVVLLATVLGRRGEFARSGEIAREALKRAETFDNPLLLAQAHNAVAYAMLMQGNYEEGRAHSKAATRYAENLAEHKAFIMGNALGNLGYLEFLAGNLDEAERIYVDLGAGYYTAEKSPIGYAFGRNNLGEILQAKGETERAMLLYEEAYEMFKSFGHKRGMAFTSNNIGGCYAMTRRYEKAAEYYNKSYKLNKEIGDRAGLGHSLSALAQIAMYEEKLEDALSYYEQAAILRQEIGDRAQYARSQAEIAIVLWMMGRVNETRPYIEETERLAEELDLSVLRGYAQLSRGTVARYEGDADAAMSYYRRVLELVDASDLDSLGEIAYMAIFALTMIADLLATHGADTQATRIIGYLESQNHIYDITESHLMARMAKDLRHALRNRMGTDYETTLAAGASLSLPEVLTQVSAIQV